MKIDYKKNDIMIRVNGDGIELYKCVEFNGEHDFVLLFRVDLKKNKKKEG